MRILPIEQHCKKSDVNMQIDFKNNTKSNILNKNCNKIAFNGVSNESLNLVQQIPLEDRLASMFEKFLHGDLILVGKKLNQAKLKMLDCVNNLDCVVKRIFFIPDDKINGYLGFTKNREGVKEVINLNDYDIKLMDAEAVKTEPLTPKDSFYVYENDIIGLPSSKTTIQIKSKPKVDLKGYRKNFCQAKDFEENIKYEMEKLNKKTISQLTKELTQTSSKVTFKDVGGHDSLIREIKRSIIFPLKFPEAYSSFDVNKGFVFYGPPGVGKTHIARAIANESGINFIDLSGKNLESKWVGESEGNWEEIFEEARQKQPSIIFIDEIDAIGKARGSVDVHGDKLLDFVLALITKVDNERDNVFIIGATNNFKALDSALTRSGRLSKHIKFDLPDEKGIEHIYNIYAAKKPIDKNLDKSALFQKLYGIKVSGADIRYIMNEAHFFGYERAGIEEKMDKDTYSGKDLHSFKIIQEDFDKAIQKFIETRNGTDAKPIGFNK